MDSLVFPKNSIDIILEKGKTPFIRLMFRSVFEQNQEDPKYKMKDILNGRYDAAIIAWANEAKNCSTNLLVEFGTEVNGVWFSWNGYYYGGGTCDEYGDPNYPDGPEYLEILTGTLSTYVISRVVIILHGFFILM